MDGVSEFHSFVSSLEVSYYAQEDMRNLDSIASTIIKYHTFICFPLKIKSFYEKHQQHLSNTINLLTAAIVTLRKFIAFGRSLKAYGLADVGSCMCLL